MSAVVSSWRYGRRGPSHGWVTSGSNLSRARSRAGCCGTMGIRLAWQKSTRDGRASIGVALASSPLEWRNRRRLLAAILAIADEPEVGHSECEQYAFRLECGT